MTSSYSSRTRFKQCKFSNNYNANYNKRSDNTPYTNPYVKTPNNNNNLHVLRNSYKSDNYNSNNKYNPNVDENVFELDYAEYTDITNDSSVIDHNQLNPIYKVTDRNTFQDRERECFLLDRNKKTLSPEQMKELPCFDKFKGTCTLSQASCKYSHQDHVLRELWQRKNAEVKSSPYADSQQRNIYPQHSTSDRLPPRNRILQRSAPENTTNKRLFSIEDPEEDPSVGSKVSFDTSNSILKRLDFTGPGTPIFDQEQDQDHPGEQDPFEPS